MKNERKGWTKFEAQSVGCLFEFVVRQLRSLCLSYSHTYSLFCVWDQRGASDLRVTGNGFDHVVGSRHKVKGYLSGSADSRLDWPCGNCLKCQLYYKTFVQTISKDDC